MTPERLQELKRLLAKWSPHTANHHWTVPFEELLQEVERLQGERDEAIGEAESLWDRMKHYQQDAERYRKAME